jgi:hypothetical protein
MMIKRLNNVMIEVEVDESETEDESDFNRWSCTATADSSIERFIVEYTK